MHGIAWFRTEVRHKATVEGSPLSWGRVCNSHAGLAVYPKCTHSAALLRVSVRAGDSFTEVSVSVCAGSMSHLSPAQFILRQSGQFASQCRSVPCPRPQLFRIGGLVFFLQTVDKTIYFFCNGTMLPSTWRKWRSILTYQLEIFPSDRTNREMFVAMDENKVSHIFG